MSLILQFFCFCFLLFFFTIGFMAQRYTIVLQQNGNFSIKRALRCEGFSLDVEIKQYYRKTDKTLVTVNFIVFTVIRVTKWHYIFVSLFAFRSKVSSTAARNMHYSKTTRWPWRRKWPMENSVFISPIDHICVFRSFFTRVNGISLQFLQSRPRPFLFAVKDNVLFLCN